jgi:hypothetical protein
MLFEISFFRSIGPLRATAAFPRTWPIFEGHFPTTPVVPAYALVGLVLAHAEHALSCPVEIDSLTRLKLARAVGPDEEIVSELSPLERQGDVVTVRSRLSLSASGSEVGTISLLARVGA